MSEARYNIPKQYKIDKGMPIEFLGQKILNVKCRQIFDTEVEKITWCYQITDNETRDVKTQMQSEGISLFEVVMKHKVSTELMTEIISGLISKRFIIMYICDGELSIGTYIPAQNGIAARMAVTDYYPYDQNRIIEVIDFEQDNNKNTAQIQKRFLQTVRYQRKMIMIEKAFENMNKKAREKEISETKEEIKAEIKSEKSIASDDDSFFNFDEEEIRRIREDALYVQQQLTV